MADLFKLRRALGVFSVAILLNIGAVANAANESMRAEAITIDGTDYNLYQGFMIADEKAQEAPADALGLIAGHVVKQAEHAPKGTLGFLVPVNDNNQGVVLTGKFLVRCASNKLQCLDSYKKLPNVEVRLIDADHGLGELKVETLSSWQNVYQKLNSDKEAIGRVTYGLDQGRILRNHDAGLFTAGSGMFIKTPIVKEIKNPEELLEKQEQQKNK